MRAGIADKRRTQHIHVVGAVNSGKSFLLASLIVQDILKGYSVIVIDPHKDLIRLVYKLLIKQGFTAWERLVPWIPGDLSLPWLHTWNLIGVRNGLTPSEAARRFAMLCRRIWAEVDVATAGMPLFTEVANNVLTVAASDNQTIFVSHEILMRRAFREALLPKVANPAVANWFHRYFDNLNIKGGPRGIERIHQVAGSFIRRINAFENSDALRFLVGTRTSTLDFDRLTRAGQVLLCDFSGLAETDERKFLMTMLVQEIARVIFARERPQDRQPCALYIDECALVLENLGSANILDDLTTQARKFGLMLVLAHQGMMQIGDPLLRSSLLRIPTQICFRQNSRDDAEIMARDMFKLDFEKAIRHRAKRGDQFDREWQVQELWERYITELEDLDDRFAYLRLAPLKRKMTLLGKTFEYRFGRSRTRRFITDFIDVDEVLENQVDELIAEGLRRHGRRLEEVIEEVDGHYKRPRRTIREEVA